MKTYAPKFKILSSIVSEEQIVDGRYIAVILDTDIDPHLSKEPQEPRLSIRSRLGGDIHWFTVNRYLGAMQGGYLYQLRYEVPSTLHRIPLDLIAEGRYLTLGIALEESEGLRLTVEQVSDFQYVLAELASAVDPSFIWSKELGYKFKEINKLLNSNLK